MRKFLFAVALLGVTALASPAARADTGHVVYLLNAQNGSGESGTVVLIPLGASTRVEIALAHAPAGVPQPAHVHVGPCATLNPKPTYGLASVVDGYSVTTLKVPIDTLIAGTFSVNVQKSPTEAGTYVSCGDLK
jgi:hypothetical protein